MEKNSKINYLIYIFVIPILTIAVFLFSSIFIYTYFNKKDGAYMSKMVEKELIRSKKELIKNRVNFVLKCIEIKQKELKQNIKEHSYTQKEIERLTNETKKTIKNTINNLFFKDSGYVFIYKILNYNGGDRFAIMIANPNRKDLIGKHISDRHKDVKGFEFRKAFLKGIRSKGEVFVRYWYKKPNSNKISPKISYFKLNKEWNWVVASGEYLDKIYQNTKKREEQIISNIKRNNNILILIATIIFFISLFFSLGVYKLTKDRFRRYEEFIKRQKRALTHSNRLLKKELFRDSLTGLKNRNLLLRNLQKRDFLALVIIDIDEFKMINELYGSLTGNEVLQFVASLLCKFSKENLSKSPLYRLGSDEFVLLIRKDLPPVNTKEMLVELYKYILSNEFNLVKDINLTISVTMGVSLIKRDALVKADMALNYAKKNNKALVIYSPFIDNRTSIDKNIKIKQSLLKAIEEDRIAPYFQPICDKNRKIRKYEVLMRMIDKDKNEPITPDKFLDISKKLKIYPTLSKIIIDKSFEAFKDNSYYFSINLSLNDMINLETVRYIEDKIVKNRHMANRVVFEILESEGIEDFNIVREFIKKIKKLGAKIAIDDFGSGYSSFRYILEIKPDFIKIDGSLIKDILNNHDSYLMVKNIIDMAKDLDVVSVAEFVSSKEIFEVLKELGVDEFQGYYIGKPDKNII